MRCVKRAEDQGVVCIWSIYVCYCYQAVVDRDVYDVSAFRVGDSGTVCE